MTRLETRVSGSVLGRAVPSMNSETVPARGWIHSSSVRHRQDLVVMAKRGYHSRTAWAKGKPENKVTGSTALESSDSLGCS